MSKKGVVLLSGGIDSAVCFAIACNESEVIQPVHIDYGQRTEETEVEKSKSLVDWANERWDTDIRDLITVDYEGIFSLFSAGLTDDSVEFDGQKEDDEYNPAYVPIRNLHFLSLAASILYDIDGDEVWFGAQAGEEGMDINPDVRWEFVFSAQTAINHSLSPDDMVKVRTPFVDKGKNQVIARGHSLDVPWVFTWSCYNSPSENGEACGRCDACYERIEAFKKLGIEDPIEYES